MSAVETPALASSVMAPAASEAEYWVSAPARMAASRRDSKSREVALVAAAAADMDASKSANLLTASPTPAAMARPATVTDWPTCSQSALYFLLEAVVSLAKSRVALDALRIPAR